MSAEPPATQAPQETQAPVWPPEVADEVADLPRSVLAEVKARLAKRGVPAALLSAPEKRD